MAKAWSYWFPDLRTHVPGCPSAIAAHELRRAAQAFFKSTRAWQVTLPLVPVAANQSSVVVATDALAELVRLEQAWYDDKPLQMTTADDLDAAYGTDWNLTTGTPLKLYQLTPGVLRLYPTPLAASAKGLKLRVSQCPSDTATGLDDEMAVKYRDDIHVGAKARLMLYPGKPWNNPAMAGVYAAAFDAMVGKANFDASRSFNGARKRATPKWC